MAELISSRKNAGRCHYALCVRHWKICRPELKKLWNLFDAGTCIIVLNRGARTVDGAYYYDNPATDLNGEES